MSRIKIHRREGHEVTNTIGHDRLIFEFDRVDADGVPDGTVGRVTLVVSPDGYLWFEGVPHEDPHVAGAIWVGQDGIVRASLGAAPDPEESPPPPDDPPEEPAP